MGIKARVVLGFLLAIGLVLTREGHANPVCGGGGDGITVVANDGFRAPFPPVGQRDVPTMYHWLGCYETRLGAPSPPPPLHLGTGPCTMDWDSPCPDCASPSSYSYCRVPPSCPMDGLSAVVEGTPGAGLVPVRFKVCYVTSEPNVSVTLRIPGVIDREWRNVAPNLVCGDGAWPLPEPNVVLVPVGTYEVQLTIIKDGFCGPAGTTNFYIRGETENNDLVVSQSNVELVKLQF